MRILIESVYSQNYLLGPDWLIDTYWILVIQNFSNLNFFRLIDSHTSLN